MLSQSQSDQDVISVPVFLEMLLEADNVVAPLGPDQKPVLSRIEIHARGNGFEDITRSVGLGVRVTPLGEQPAGIADGERLEVEAFFDITYQLEIIDMDPDEDLDPKFSPSQGRIRLRLPRGQSSRIEARGTCIADTSITNFGCLPQLVDPRDPQLAAVNAPIWIRDNTFPLGSEATLSLPDTKSGIHLQGADSVRRQINIYRWLRIRRHECLGCEPRVDRLIPSIQRNEFLYGRRVRGARHSGNSGGAGQQACELFFFDRGGFDGQSRVSDDHDFCQHWCPERSSDRVFLPRPESHCRSPSRTRHLSRP